VVNPSDLREALSHLPNTVFEVGEMSDAMELLDVLFNCIAQADGVNPADPSSRGNVVDTNFGIYLRESVECSNCGKSTHRVATHYEHTVTVQVIGLVTPIETPIEATSSWGWCDTAEQTRCCESGNGGRSNKLGCACC
jgi:hypothetical protein